MIRAKKNSTRDGLTREQMLFVLVRGVQTSANNAHFQKLSLVVATLSISKQSNTHSMTHVVGFITKSRKDEDKLWASRIEMFHVFIAHQE